MGREKCGWQQKPGRTGLSAFVAKKEEMEMKREEEGEEEDDRWGG